MIVGCIVTYASLTPRPSNPERLREGLGPRKSPSRPQSEWDEDCCKAKGPAQVSKGPLGIAKISCMSLGTRVLWKATYLQWVRLYPV